MVKLLFPQPVTTFHFPPSFPGTPTEDTWPGITSNEEFRAYNFTQYRAQLLINHAPRYPPSLPPAQIRRHRAAWHCSEMGAGGTGFICWM